MAKEFQLQQPLYFSAKEKPPPPPSTRLTSAASALASVSAHFSPVVQWNWSLHRNMEIHSITTPKTEKMDIATVLEEAYNLYKYIMFLEAQVSALDSMPRQSTAAASTNIIAGDLGRLTRQQLLQVVTNSAPMAAALDGEERGERGAGSGNVRFL